MKPQPLVSVVTSCYSQGHFLGAAIDSVLAQSYSRVECVVVNNGSTDCTEEVALSYGERIRFLSKEHGDMAAGRNAGIRVANGDYFLFLDADDLLHPDAIGWLVDLVDGRTDTVGVMGYRIFADSPDDSRSEEFLPPNVSPLPFLFYGSFGPPHTFLVPRGRLFEAGLFPATSHCADWALWMKLAIADTRFARLLKAGAYYRVHGQSASRKSDAYTISHGEAILMAHEALLARPARLNDLGPELLVAEKRVLRYLLAASVHDAVVTNLARATQQLIAAGHAPTQPWPLRLAERVLGVHAQTLGLAFCRWFRPGVYSRYKTGLGQSKAIDTLLEQGGRTR